MKKTVLALTLLLALSAFTGCTSDRSSDVAEPSSKPPVETFEHPMDVDSTTEKEGQNASLSLEKIVAGLPKNVDLLKQKGNTLCYFSYVSDIFEISIIDLSNGNHNTIIPSDSPKGNLSDYEIAEDGSVWTSFISKEQKNKTEITHFSSDGTMQQSFKVDKPIFDMAVDKNGYLLLFIQRDPLAKQNENELKVVDFDGNLKKEMTLDAFPYLFHTNDGTALLTFHADSPAVLEYNPDTSDMVKSKTEDLVDNIKSKDISRIGDGAYKYSFFIIGDSEIYGYNTDTNQLETLVDSNSEVFKSEYPVNNVFMLNKTTLCISVYDSASSSDVYKTIQL